MRVDGGQRPSAVSSGRSHLALITGLTTMWLASGVVTAIVGENAWAVLIPLGGVLASQWSLAALEPHRAAREGRTADVFAARIVAILGGTGVSAGAIAFVASMGIPPRDNPWPSVVVAVVLVASGALLTASIGARVLPLLARGPVSPARLRVGRVVIAACWIVSGLSAMGASLVGLVVASWIVQFAGLLGGLLVAAALRD